MRKLTYGVGYNPKGVYKGWENNKMAKSYSTWFDMIQRCYDPKLQEVQPTYIGCSVHPDWHNFQVFAEWCVNHEFFGSGYQLDKDLLVGSNRFYSPDTCTFIPQEINKLLSDHRAARGKYPQGVSASPRKQGCRYIARININSENVYLGYFDCPNEAYLVYKKAKEAHVKVKANEWRGRIDDRVYRNLMDWRLNE